MPGIIRSCPQSTADWYALGSDICRGTMAPNKSAVSKNEQAATVRTVSNDRFMRWNTGRPEILTFSVLETEK